MGFEKVVLFIDAGFLSKLSKYLGKGNYIQFKIKNFVDNLSKKHNFEFEKVFYYTAPPYQSNFPSKKDIKRKENYDRFKHSLNKEGIIVREGRVQRLQINENFEYKQKGVDTLLTIDLSNVKEDFPCVKKVILVSSDTDFVPIIEDIDSRGIKVLLFTYFDRKRNSPFSLSNHLVKSCTSVEYLKKEDLEKFKF